VRAALALAGVGKEQAEVVSLAADVSEIRVFIASPSDLEEERVELRRLETTLNVTFAPAGIRVRFVGWEEVPPGAQHGAHEHPQRLPAHRMGHPGLGGKGATERGARAELGEHIA
jgi:hypothetical protein